MHRIVFVLVACLFTISGFSQSTFEPQSQTEANIRSLDEKIKKEIPNHRFTENQVIRLEKVFMQANKEKAALIKKGTPKHVYAVESAKIDEKYAGKIENILTIPQRIAYNRSGTD